MNYAENIQFVINTLEDVEVKGSKNWDRLLACIQHLKTIQKEMIAHEANETALRERDPENTAGTV
jgi:hypothetical protein